MLGTAYGMSSQCGCGGIIWATLLWSVYGDAAPPRAVFLNGTHLNGDSAIVLFCVRAIAHVRILRR